MDIGSAVKSLRKEKGISQKDLALKSGLSVNALCQIEINATFPQKSTIKKICAALQVPVSYLLFFSISEEDVPKEKRLVFKSLDSAIRAVLVEDLKK
jgi:XRE family transcriptional regulator, regulator of sulfur utilization